MSDGMVGGRWGSHWRWRLALLVMVVVLIGARYVAARSWKVRKLVANCGGPPAILLSTSIHKSAIETWDWNGNQTRTLATIERHPPAEGMLRAGERVVWLAGEDLYTIDLKPPHARRRLESPFQVKSDGFRPLSLVGASIDHRFVVVQCDRFAQEEGGDVLASNELAVIDLETGKVVSRKQWNSRIEAVLDAGEFESYYTLGTSTDPNEPDRARWRLTGSGDWERTPFARFPSNTFVRDSAGHRRKLAPGENPKSDEVSEFATLVLRNQERWVMRSDENEELLIVHADTDTIHAVGHGSWNTTVSFTSDGKHLIVADDNFDLYAYEGATGRRVASETSGSFWRWYVRGVSSIWLLAAASFVVTSWQQRQIRWALIDLHVAGMIGQMGLFSLLTTTTDNMSNWATTVAMGTSVAFTAAFGMGVGWYWIHGEATIVARLSRGMLSIAAIAAVPAVTLASFNSRSELALVLLVPAFSGLFFAAVIAMCLAPLSMTGWRVSDGPILAKGRGFGLASMMLMITGAAVVMGFFKLGLFPPIEDAALDVAMFLMPVFALGLLWPGIAMLNIGRGWRIVIAVVVGGIIAAAMATRIVVRMWGWDSGLDTDGVAVGIAGMTAVFMLHMMLLVRKFGWRWRKAAAPAVELAPLEAAA